MKKVLIAIPYLAEAAQGRELDYAVAGWRRHFKEPYHIVVVGDFHPVVDTGDDITFVDCPRVPDVPGQYRAHLDHVNKFTNVLEMFPDAEGFIYTCDDIYAVNDFDMTDVRVLKQVQADITADPNSPNAWRRNNAKTRAVLAKEGLPTRNFVCHLPVWYDRKKIVDIWEKYDCAHESYVVEQLYFNTYFPTRIPVQLHIDHDNYKCGVYRSNPRIEYIKNAFRDKIWISNSPVGWIPELDRLLAEHYQI